MISKWEEEQERIAHRNAKKIIHPTMIRKNDLGDYDLEFTGGKIEMSRDDDGLWTFWSVILDNTDYGRLEFGATQPLRQADSTKLEAVRKGLDGQD